MQTIKAIVFDLGGVLVELSGVQAMIGLSKLELDEQSLWRRWLHSPTVRQFETGRIHADQFANDLIEEMQLETDPQQFLAAFTAWPTGLYQGAPALLQSLRRHFTLACLSNTSALHWPRLMDEMGLAMHLDHHFASHILGTIKPDIDCFEQVLSALNIQPHQVLFFDDNRINVDAAATLGMRAVEVQGVDGVINYFEQQGLKYLLQA